MPLSVRVTGKGIIKMNANWCLEFLEMYTSAFYWVGLTAVSGILITGAILSIRDFIQHRSTKNSQEYIDL